MEPEPSAAIRAKPRSVVDPVAKTRAVARGLALSGSECQYPPVVSVVDNEREPSTSPRGMAVEIDRREADTGGSTG